MRTLPIATWVGLALMSGCDDIDSPAELDHPQLLAIAASPSAVGPGEEAALTVLVAGQDGTLEPVRTTWTVVDGPGTIVGGSRLRAAAGATEALATVVARVELASGESLVGEKRVPVGLFNAQSPRVTDMRANGRAVDSELVVDIAQQIDLSVDIAPVPSDLDATLTTWHATCGSFARYREPVGVFETGDEPCTGSLYAVYRDELGGTVWIERSLVVSAADP